MFSRYRAILILVLAVLLLLTPAMSWHEQHHDSHLVHRWPRAVGMAAEEAVAHIQKDRPDIKIVTVPEGMMVTMEFIMTRVRVFVTPEGKVAKEPILG
jgi:hypothetical protein